jgi:pSer/pThr/pTyr-binding forkhead associated (FHA) protein
VSAILKITDATGGSREIDLLPDAVYSIGRAKDNNIVLDDHRVSRRHAQITARVGVFKIVDGYFKNGEIQQSVNRVFVNGTAHLEKILEPGEVRRRF